VADLVATEPERHRAQRREARGEALTSKLMRIQLTPAPKRRLADILYGQLLEQIMAGAVAPGDKLPTEHAICKAFGVSRPVVREALTRLQADGLVKSRRGSGTVLLRAPPAASIDFFEPADFASYLRAFEVRTALEPAAARFAAERRTHDDLVAIKAATRAFSDAVSAGQPAAKFDVAFHRAIAVASGNELFATQLDSLSVELEGFIAVTLGLTRLGSAERRSTVTLEHQRIADAVESGDGDSAATYMRFHLSEARRRLTEVTRTT
jgi:DNA-binding FadR family transcriptional regulator